MNSTSDLPLKLKEARIKKGFSQSDAADKLNISRQAISRWETGKGSPDINTLPLISELYDISIDELLGHKSPVPENELTDTEKEMPESDETSLDQPSSEDPTNTSDSGSSRANSFFNWEYIILVSLLVISSYVTFVGLITSIYIFIWTWRNRKHYKLILILAAICFLLGADRLYNTILMYLPSSYSTTIKIVS